MRHADVISRPQVHSPDGEPRTAGHRAARRTRAAAGGAADGLRRGGAAAAAAPASGSTSTCARCGRSTWRSPTTRARGEPSSPAAEWLLDNFHIISAAAARHPSRSAARRSIGGCRAIAADEFAGLPRVYAMALELIGRSAGRLDSAAAAPVRHGLPVGHAADDGRAVGVAERAEAGAASSTCARGPTSWPTSRAHRLDADRLVGALDTPARAARTLAADVHPAFVIRLLQRSREHEPAAGALRQRARRGAGRARADRRGRDSRRKAGTRRPSRRSWRT